MKLCAVPENDVVLRTQPKFAFAKLWLYRFYK